MRARDRVTCYRDTRASSRRRRRLALILVAVLLVPWIRRALEATMLAQMLVQIPLLAAVGWLARSFVTERVLRCIARWNASGITALVVASFAAMYWMLPRTLDAAVADPWTDAAKYLSVPLAIGLPLSVGWPCAGFVARGVFLAEAIATLVRVGWIYRVSPVRLCNAYPLADQQLLGLCMLALGAALFAIVAWKLLVGDGRRPRVADEAAHGIIGSSSRSAAG